MMLWDMGQKTKFEKTSQIMSGYGKRHSFLKICHAVHDMDIYI